ncbi:hypothetical protein [Metasolibacillus sp.]|uniref:hypothetical protein n=1 Tax=Metasolibacillus sp. TaxID=2703680 RepID=UPI0025CEAC45|nr:hypothetical protein [Metasolibacillus sp.]MCT6925185.1 hypothetical protein [Metasolibacillus sp.]MCT6941344.1 hypothetical protein [Metasolibacillus sp.]
MMSDSQIKKGIDAVIGEERWLTEEKVQKMLRKPKKRRLIPIIQPIFAVVAIACLAFIIYLLPPTSEPIHPANELNIERFAEGLPKLATEALKAYLQAIAQQDYAALGQVSLTDVTASNKEIILKYENVDFTTLKMIKVQSLDAGNLYQIYIAHKDVTDGEIYIHTLKVGRWGSNDFKVLEDIYEDWLVFEQFEAPKALQLTPEDAPTAQIVQIDDYQPVASNVPSPQKLNNSNVIVHFMKKRMIEQGNNTIGYSGIFLILEKDGDYYEITSFRDDPQTQYSIVERMNTIHVMNEPIGDSLKDVDYELIYYNEHIDNFQSVKGQLSKTNGPASFQTNLTEEPLYTFDGAHANIAFVQDGTLKQINILDAMDMPLLLKELLAVRMVGGEVFDIQYQELYTERSTPYYYLHSLEEASMK